MSSGRKNILRQFKMIDNGDMSQSSLTSAPTNIQFLDNVAIQFNFTGAPSGTFSIEVSADYEQDIGGATINVGNWVPVTLPTPPVASGSAGSVFIDLNQLAAPWVRVKYTKTSGTGSLTAWISAKML